MLTGGGLLIASTVDAIFDMWWIFRAEWVSYVYALIQDFTARKRLLNNTKSALIIATSDDLTIELFLSWRGCLLIWLLPPQLWSCFVLWRNKQNGLFPFISLAMTARPAAEAGSSSRPSHVYHSETKGERSRHRSSTERCDGHHGYISNSPPACIDLEKCIERFPDQKRPPTYPWVAAVIIESATPLAIFGICHITSIGLYMVSSLSSPTKLFVLISNDTGTFPTDNHSVLRLVSQDKIQVEGCKVKCK